MNHRSLRPVASAHLLAAFVCASAALLGAAERPDGDLDQLFAASAALAALLSLVGWRGWVAATFALAVLGGAGAAAIDLGRPLWWIAFGLATVPAALALPVIARRDPVATAVVTLACAGVAAGLVPRAEPAAERLGRGLRSLEEPTGPVDDYKRAAIPAYKEAYALGALQAEIDLAYGRPRWLVYGEIGGPRFLARLELLRARYGVHAEIAAGCVVSAAQMGRVRGYDERIRRWIDTTHGAGAFAALRDEARRRAYDELPPVVAREVMPRLGPDTPGWAVSPTVRASWGFLGRPPSRR